MGGAVSSGRDNNELIDNLMGGGYIRTRSVERVFRVLDRADYMTPMDRDQAYKDLAWRSGALHLSAPCIYSEVVEALELKPGLSFLNLGSGTGYLSTLVGLLIGSGGTSHGVEIHPRVVEYSTKKLSQFQENSVTLDEFDFCIPKYYCGNALSLAPLQGLYDRVYVGAGVLSNYENYFKQLIKVNGLVVMPLGDTLVQIRRVSETEWTSRHLLNVSFALLRPPTTEESAEPLKLDSVVPAPLAQLSRAAIRRAMLAGVCRRHPELREPPPRRATAARQRPRRICIPIDPDTDDAGLNALHDLGGEEGGREMNALLSLVLNMGNNRAAGSLRLADDRPPHPHNELEVVIDEIERGSGTDSGSGSGSGSGSSSDSDSSTDSERPAPPPRRSPPPAPPAPTSPAPEDTRVRPSAAGATSPHTERTASVSGSSAAWAEARGTVSAAAASGTELSALNPAGRVEVDDTEVVVEPKPSWSLGAEGCTCGHELRPSASGHTPHEEDLPARRNTASNSSSGSGGGQSGTKRGGDSARRPRPRPAAPPAPPARPCHSKRRKPEQVQIYFGNNMCLPDEALPGRASSSDDDEPPAATGQKRQKLDSGIGEGTASSSSSSAPRSDSSDSEHTDEDADADADAEADVDNPDSGSGQGRARRGSCAAGALGRRARRSQRDARRVRLSVAMKRAVKELPLPYPLQKYVNLHRCFEF